MPLHNQAAQISAGRSSSGASGSYRLVVVKAGTSLLTGGTDRLDPEVMATLVDQIAMLQSSDRQMMLVTSGAAANARSSPALRPLRRVSVFRAAG